MALMVCPSWPCAAKTMANRCSTYRRTWKTGSSPRPETLSRSSPSPTIGAPPKPHRCVQQLDRRLVEMTHVPAGRARNSRSAAGPTELIVNRSSCGFHRTDTKEFEQIVGREPPADETGRSYMPERQQWIQVPLFLRRNPGGRLGSLGLVPRHRRAPKTENSVQAIQRLMF